MRQNCHLRILSKNESTFWFPGRPPSCTAKGDGCQLLELICLLCRRTRLCSVQHLSQALQCRQSSLLGNPCQVQCFFQSKRLESQFLNDRSYLQTYLHRTYLLFYRVIGFPCIPHVPQFQPRGAPFSLSRF